MIVLDASTLIAALLAERGAEDILPLLETQDCTMSVVNVCEVHERLLAGGASHREARSLVDELDVRVIPFERDDAELAAALRDATRHAGLGIADRACIATGMRRDAVIFTADRAWDALDLPEADIRIVR